MSLLVDYLLAEEERAGFIGIYHEREGGIEKSIPRITVWHHEAYRVMTNGDHEERIFLSYNGVFSCSQLVSTLYYLKMLPQVLPDPLSSITLYTPGCRMKAYK